MALTGLTNLQPLHIKTVGIGTFDNTVSIGGTLSYEDVTNVDAIGIITARSGIKVLAGGINAVGVITATTFKGDGSQLSGISVDSTVLKDSGGNTRVTGTLTGAVVTGILTATASMNVKQSGNAYVNILSTGTGNAGIFMDASNGDIAGSDYCFIGQHNNLDFVIQANSNAGKFDFQRGNTSHLVISTNGNVGIGTDNPLNKLDVRSGISVYSPNGLVRYQLGVDNSNGVSLLSKNAAGSYNTYQIDANTFAVRTTGTNSPVERFRIESDGKVGIGTTNPDAKLTIDENNASQHLQLRNTTNLSRFGAIGVADDFSLRLYSDNGLRLKIDADGHVGLTTTGALKIPVGNDSQRPSSSVAGDIRFNSSSQTLEFYTGSAWVGTNAAPSLNSITGDIYNGMSGRTLVINCNDISASGNDVKYSNNSTGATIATDGSATTSGSNITSTIPAAVYNTAAGTVIKIEVVNGGGVLSSNSLTKTILSSPSGGTITSAGGYRYHTFTSSGTFVNTIASLDVQYLVVAGGGGGGGNQGGGAGGAGGYRTGSATLGTGNYSASIGGGGGNGGNGNSGYGSDGGNSSFNSLTSTGGGGGANMNTGAQTVNGRSGGSGGGASHWLNGNGSGGSGTSGQGNGGGDARDTEGLGHNGGGGGGAGSAGTAGQGAYGGNGGNGSTWLNGVTYAGGGGGGCYYSNNSGGSSYSIGGGAGTGGGGRGSRNVGSQLSTNFTSPTTNQNGVDGYGGGGGGGGNNPGDGGDGVVIVRYAG